MKHSRTASLRVMAAVCLAHMFPIGTLYMSLPVLFPEISSDINLTQGQVAFAWASIPLASAFTVIIGGMLADRFGERSVGAISILLASAFAAGRVFALDLMTFEISLIGFGASSAVTYVCLPKLISRFFEGKQNSVAQGLSFSAFALGGIIATLISVPLSEQLGSWRWVSAVFAGLSGLTGLAWILLIPKCRKQPSSLVSSTPTINRADLIHLLSDRRILLLALSYGALTGGNLGFTGLLPTWMANWGWPADTGFKLLATAQVSFLAGAILIPALADTLSARVATYTSSMIIAGIMAVIAWGLISQGPQTTVGIWFLMAGIGTLSGAIGIYFALITETLDIDSRLLGTVLGIVTLASYAGGAGIPLAAGLIMTSSPMMVGALFGFAGFVVSGLATFYAFRWQLDEPSKKLDKRHAYP